MFTGDALSGPGKIGALARSGASAAAFPWRAVAALLLMSAVVRLYMLLNTAVISVDGVEYIRVAGLYGSLRFSEALGQSYPPVFPMLIALFHLPGIPWEMAGQLISFAAGLLTFFPVVFLVRRVYDAAGAGGAAGSANRLLPAGGAAFSPGVKVALVTGMLFAFQPELVRYSGQVRSEACYILFLMCALCLGWRAISSGKYRFFALHGLFATLAYLTRPEGMGLLLVMAAWVLMGFPRAFRLPWRRRLACVLAAFAPTLILAGAYVAYISTVPSSVNEPWHVRLTLKRQLSDFLAGEYISDEFRPGDETLPESMHFFVPVLGWLRSYVELAGRLFCKDLYPLLALLLVLALARRRENPRDGPFEFFVFGNVTFYLGIFAFVRVCHRLPVQLVAPLLFLPALGVLELVGFARTRLNLSGRAATRLGAIILIVLAAAMTQQFVSPERAKRESVKLAGQWIRENSRAENPRIATDLVRVVFYAEGTRIDPPLRHVGSRRSALDRSKLQQMIRDGDADYLAICPEHLSAKDMEYLSSAPGLNFVASFKPALEDGQEVTLFEFSRDNRSPGNRAEPARD